MENIAVSVLCMTYNHEKYIHDCLDGFVKQKTNFTFEVIIHDDASTDGTQNIIKEYCELYPKIFKPVFQKENQYSSSGGIIKNHILPKANGKYIAICEGDDYWIDPYKLQKQYNALETYSECNICISIVQGIKDNINEHLFPLPIPNSRIISKDDFVKSLLNNPIFPQTSCYFFKGEYYRKYYKDRPDFSIGCGISDLPILLYFGTLGDVYFINEILSCYRMGTIGSWTSRYKDKNKHIERCKREIKMIEKFNIYSNYIYNSECKNKIKRYLFSIALTNHEYEILFKKENYELFKKICPTIIGRIRLRIEYVIRKLGFILRDK